MNFAFLVKRLSHKVQNASSLVVQARPLRQKKVQLAAH
jgi:hypothetical protein